MKRLQIDLIRSLCHPNVFAFIFLIVAVTALFLPAMVGWRGIFHDDQAMEEFSRYYFVARNLQSGVIPLWDPHTWCGAIPFYARYYANTYYLPLWPFYFLANLSNLTHTYWLLILLPLWLHYILAAIGMFILLRRLLKCGYISSCFGAIAYVYSPTFAYAYVWQQVVSVQSWLPWLIIIYVSAVERWRLWKLLLAGIFFSFIITAAAPTLWPFVAFLWGSIVILLTIGRLRTKEKRSVAFTPIFVAFAIGIIGVGLSSVYLCSFFNGMKYTQEHIKLATETALYEPCGSLPPLYLATLFIPNLFGNITGTNMPFLNPTYNVVYWEANLSGGMGLSLLVVLGLVSVFKIPSSGLQECNRRWYVVLAAALYLFAVLCVLGRYTPFYKYVIGYLPGIRQFPRPIRYRMLQCFAAAVLSAIGLEYLTTSLFSQMKYRLRFWVWFYVIISFFVIGAAMAWPLASRNEISYGWFGKPGPEIEGYFSSGESVGNYSPSGITKKLGVFFDGASSGEIRYTDNHKGSPGDGALMTNYYVPSKGWYEFDVNIPGRKFVWIYQKAGEARIGYKRFRFREFLKEFPFDSFTYDKEWFAHPDYNTICFYQELHNRVNSMIAKLIAKDIDSKPIVISIFYWIFASIALVLGIYCFSQRRFGYLLGIIAMVEFFVFGVLAFYGGTFAFDKPYPNHVRAIGPSTHPMLQRVVKSLTTTVNDSTLRIATTQPFYDNFVRMNGHFALMGYEMHPLEIRFKQAIERTYDQTISDSMAYFIYYTEFRPRPENNPFLNHFSVGYLMSASRLRIFSNGRILTLPGEPQFFVHINPDALPRLFTMDCIILASEEEQLTQLVSGNLRQAVYVSPYEGIKSRESIVREDIASHFSDLQKANRILRFNLDNPNRIEVDMEVNIPAMLVLTEVWYPGWKVTMDNQPVKIYRVNFCQRGVWLEKGGHEIRFCFQPVAWLWGIKISLVTIALMLVLLALTVTRHKLLLRFEKLKRNQST